MLLSALLAACAAVSAHGQATGTYTPYSIYGVGDLSQPGTAYNKSMGGVGVALRNNMYINVMNPASVTARDSLSFMADFSVYGDNKVFKQVWDDYSLNPDELLEDIWRSIPDWSEINEVSDGLWRREIPAYDEKVVREVLCNSIAHRPYTTRGDVFINIYPDRMVVVNPGRLPLGVTPENILRTTVKRNKELSRLFYALHIMEGEGSGYDLMYETQLSVGKTIPVVTEGEDSVAVTLERKIVSKEASRIYDYMQYAYPEVFIHQKAMIAFGLILQEEIISSEELSRKRDVSSRSVTRRICLLHY